MAAARPREAMTEARSLRRRKISASSGDSRMVRSVVSSAHRFKGTEPMPTSFRECRDDEFMLLPVDMRDWLPEGHPAYLIRDMVREMDLSPFCLPCAGDGRRNRPHDPRMMAAVLIYAYATGVFSSRRIARRLHEDVAFRMLCGGSFPRHRTICEFRRRHLGDFRHLFLEVVRLARESGMVRLGTVTVDGAKVRANASKRKATGHGRMQAEERRLEAEIAALVERAGEVDAEEDAVHGADSGDGGVPEEISRRESRLEAIRAAKARLEARQRAADDAKGRKPGEDRNPRGGRPYKRPHGEPRSEGAGQLHRPGEPDHEDKRRGLPAVLQRAGGGRRARQVIVATEVGQEAGDQGRLVAMLDRVEADAGGSPGEVLADAGYCSEEEIAALEARGIEAFVALGREGRKQAAIDGRRRPATRRMAERMAGPEGRKRYARRKWIAEAPHGWIKEAMGFRRFSVRGLEKVRGEWDLVCLALNARRMATALAG